MDITTQDNFILAERLRNEDPEQFYTLVKMHLSFVLDLNADECDSNAERKFKTIKWNLPFTKRQKNVTKTTSEGFLLNADFISQMRPVIEFLSKKENISQEGIFRRSGRVTRQQELKLLLQQGAELNFNNGQFSVHECATVLKNILSELPESILTDAHYPAYCQIAELCTGKTSANNERLLRSIQLLILLLPHENRKFFQEIIELLNLAVSHEDKNRMSADNLATLFTPHLLCPRKLSPEALHINSQVMSKVVAFMIEKGSKLFEIPPTVATDVRAYWNKKEIRKLSSLKQMNESICDGAAANTVFTFVDRERTAQENKTNPTETALAQLYAYIQSLPESSKKRKLIKQFNKENGCGTPLRVGGKKRTKALNLGDSIKKHLSSFSKTTKRNWQQEVVVGNDEITSPELMVIKQPQKADEKISVQENVLNIDVSNNKVTKHRTFDEKAMSSLKDSFKLPDRSKNIDEVSNIEPYNSYEFESLNHDLRVAKSTNKRSSSSPIKTSPCKSLRASENITAKQLRSELSKYVKWPVSNERLHSHNNFKKSNLSRSFFGSEQKLNREAIGGVSECNSCTISKIAVSNVQLCQSFANKNSEKFSVSNFGQNTNNDSFWCTPNNTNRLPILCGSKNSLLITTSTPAPGNGGLLTPIADKNNSMSPITKSTRRMPKAMQETMMTPRSRKPVISLSGTHLCDLANSDSLEGDSFNSKPKQVFGKKLILEDSNEENGNDSLSSTFRNYLFSRSVLTASPVDLSFSSRTDDFLSLSDKSPSEENEHFKSLPEILNEAGLSESLLYCLDGNEPQSDSKVSSSRTESAECSCFFTDSDENVHDVYETAL